MKIRVSKYEITVLHGNYHQLVEIRIGRILITAWNWFILGIETRYGGIALHFGFVDIVWGK